MPIYHRTYRRFEAKRLRRFRWWIMTSQELRVLGGSKIFLFLLFIAMMHVLLRFIQVVLFDVVAQDANNPLAPLLARAADLAVNERMFCDFVRLQSPLMFILLLYAGSGMICNDLRNNLTEVYFSKPLSWWDYTLGKTLALVILGMSVTAGPVIYLCVMHAMFLPGWKSLGDALHWAASGTAFSAVVVLPTALGTLASSTLFKNQGYAAIGVFMLLIAESTIAITLAELLRERNYLVLSFPMAINRVGQQLFTVERPFFDLHWGWSMLSIVTVSVFAFWIVARRARRAEVAA